MRKINCFLLAVAFLGCKTKATFRSPSEKNIGIEWTFSERVHEDYMHAIDSMISLSIARYNAESHTYSFHKKKAVDKEYVTLHFTTGKKITSKQKTTGYIVSGIGLIGIPAAMVAVSAGFVVGFYYFPMNVMDAKVSLSPVMTDSIYHYKKMRVQSGALFRSESLQQEKLYNKFRSRFTALLSELNRKFEMKK